MRSNDDDECNQEKTFKQKIYTSIIKLLLLIKPMKKRILMDLNFFLSLYFQLTRLFYVFYSQCMSIYIFYLKCWHSRIHLEKDAFLRFGRLTFFSIRNPMA